MNWTTLLNKTYFSPAEFLVNLKTLFFNINTDLALSFNEQMINSVYVMLRYGILLI